MKKTGVWVTIGALLIIAVGLVVTYGFYYMVDDSVQVVLETNVGEITIELYSDMPVTAGNFKRLVEEGFYDGILFHRVVSGFVIQAGDPLTKEPDKEDYWGSGGPGYSIEDEFPSNYDHSNLRGTMAMANAGPDTGGSQFFINLRNNVLLDSRHPVFGEVVEGMNVVDEIGRVGTDSKEKPIEEIRIVRAYVK